MSRLAQPTCLCSGETGQVVFGRFHIYEIRRLTRSYVCAALESELNSTARFRTILILVYKPHEFRERCDPDIEAP